MEIETLREGVNTDVNTSNDGCNDTYVQRNDNRNDKCKHLKDWLANTLPKLKRERGYTSNSAGRLIKSIEELAPDS